MLNKKRKPVCQPVGGGVVKANKARAQPVVISLCSSDEDDEDDEDDDDDFGQAAR